MLYWILAAAAAVIALLLLQQHRLLRRQEEQLSAALKNLVEGAEDDQERLHIFLSQTIRNKTRWWDSPRNTSRMGNRLKGRSGPGQDGAQ